MKFFRNTTLRELLPSLLKHPYFRAGFGGALLPLGFAPFHFPGLVVLGLAVLFSQLTGLLKQTRGIRKQSFLTGFFFGLTYFGLGVSWVYVSIHEYGHLNALLSGFITLLFIAYLALFTGVMGYLFLRFASMRYRLNNVLLFSLLWCFCEYFRATFLSGFPWLLVGFSQVDTPLQHLLPIIGLYGVSFLVALAAGLLVIAFRQRQLYSLPWLIPFLAIFLLPTLLKSIHWTDSKNTPISVGVIQANLSMHDKWDEALFHQLLQYYYKKTLALIPDKQLVVMPESAIPAPTSFVTDFLNELNQKAKNAHAGLLLGVPDELSRQVYYNALIGLGTAEGIYRKRHLVPFGEFIPAAFQTIMQKLDIPIINLSSGQTNQSLIEVDHHPIATLICYEVAYPDLLRNQLPIAEWIVSISDDGWFGHSFAVFQQLQMSQALSIMTGRYQIVANNDGLSSIINAQGKITQALPAHEAGILNGHILPFTGTTPWLRWGDTPMLFSFIFLFIGLWLRQLMPTKLTQSVPSLDSD